MPARPTPAVAARRSCASPRRRTTRRGCCAAKPSPADRQGARCQRHVCRHVRGARLPGLRLDRFRSSSPSRRWSRPLTTSCWCGLVRDQRPRVRPDGLLAGILSVMGYSINDTIVVFDRVRENSARCTSCRPVEVRTARSTRRVAHDHHFLRALLTVLALYFYAGASRAAWRSRRSSASCSHAVLDLRGLPAAADAPAPTSRT